MHWRFQTFLDYAKRLREDYPALRKGQAHMNVLANWEPAMYEKISLEHKVDPFYDDEKLGDFFLYVSSNMPEYYSVCSHTEKALHKCEMCRQEKN